MSVDNHRHCQATVLGATGEPFEEGLTWNEISTLPLDNLPENWIDYFTSNINVTQDLAGILKLLNWIAGRTGPSAGVGAGDLIKVSSDRVNVRNDIEQGYTGPVGITGSGTGRKLTKCDVSVNNTYPNGPVIARLNIGGQIIEIHGQEGSQ